MQVITETELLERINEFRARHDDMAPTTFGRSATGNANLIKELEDGKSPSLRTVQRIVAYMTQVDGEVALKAKLNAPLAQPEPDGEAAEEELPFSNAPGLSSGASSPISSPTNGPAAAGRRSCSATSATSAAVTRPTSCSGADT